MADLILDRLAVSVRDRAILRPVSASIAAGQLVAAVGANGAGKSTLLRAIAALTPATGSAAFAGQSLATLPPRERARLVAYLPQSHSHAWPVPVRDMVALGRYAFGEAPGSAASDASVADALAQCGIAHLADRPLDQLSGGEQAMAALARVLAAQCPLMLLDEPVAALDIGRQYQLLELLAGLAARGRTLLVVLHDLSLVSQFADRILWLDAGALVADTPNDRAAIDAHAGRLLGRAPRWDAGDKGLYFSRE